MKKAAILLISAAMLALSPTCAKAVTMEDIFQGGLASIEDQRTLRAEMNMTVHMWGVIDGRWTDATMTIEESAAVDRDAHRYQSTTTATLEGVFRGQSEDLTTLRKVYLLDDMYYLGVKRDEDYSETWRKLRVTAAPSDVQDRLAWHTGTSGIVDAKLLRSESVGGTHCHVLEYTPNSEAFYDFLRSSFPAYDLGLTESSVTHVTCRDWFSKDTYQIVKSLAECRLRMEPGWARLEAECEVEIIYSNHNEPVNIELSFPAKKASLVETLGNITLF